MADSGIFTLQRESERFDGRDAAILRMFHPNNNLMTSTDLAEAVGVTRQAVHARLRTLIEQGVIGVEGSGTNTKYFLKSPSAAAGVFPETSPQEIVKRKILAHALKWQSDPMARRVRKEMGGEKRPEVYFDVVNIIHPAFTADVELTITGYSDSLVEVFGRKPRAGETFVDYFHQHHDMLPWSLARDAPEYKQHFIDSLVLPELGKVQDGDAPHLRYKLVRFRRDRSAEDYKYFFFSFVAQRAYPGIQCIANEATELVRRVREINRSLEWMYGLRPEIRQPLNAVASAKVSLDVLARKMDHSRVFGEIFDARQIIAKSGVSDPAAAEALRLMERSIRDAQTQISDWQLKLYTVGNALNKVKDKFAGIADRLPMPEDAPNQEIQVLEILDGEVNQLRDWIDADQSLERRNWFVNFEDARFSPLWNARIEGLPFMVREALRALLKNAFDACNNAIDTDRKTINITYHQPQPRTIAIRIENTGLMEPERMAALNQRAKTEAPIAASDFGKVSGCVVAMRTARRAGGTLIYEPIPGIGGTAATFTAPLSSELVLPVDAEDASRTAANT